MERLYRGSTAMKKFRFVWIDDKIDKVQNFLPAIETGLDRPRLAAKVEQLRVRSGFLETLNVWADENKASPPDLFIIDQVYNLKLPFDLKGSSVAHLLRTLFPLVPMVCVTAVPDDTKTRDDEEFSEYTAVFPYGHLEERLADLFFIARDFKKLTVRANGDVRRHLVQCLKPPSRDQADLLRLLPEEFQGRRQHTTEHRMARWIYNVLLQRPGFLYDRLAAATMLGLNDLGFSSVEENFAKARYSGVFANPFEPKWWISELKRILFFSISSEGPDNPQMAGRLLPGIEARHFSKCFFSRTANPPPDAVAYVDNSRNAARKPVRKEFTEQRDYDLGTLPGFEVSLVIRKR
jgi:hypothetical protein